MTIYTNRSLYLFVVIRNAFMETTSREKKIKYQQIMAENILDIGESMYKGNERKLGLFKKCIGNPLWLGQKMGWESVG